MSYDCPTCGKKAGINEYKTDDFSDADYANLNIFSEDPTHSLDILYLLPPWRCEFCKTVLLRGKGESARKETGHVCSLCKEGMLSEYENASVGKIVVRDTFEEGNRGLNISTFIPSSPKLFIPKPRLITGGNKCLIIA
jgi:hypothetical protein